MAPQSMPKEIEEKLFQINDPDTIREIQQQWNEYVASNDNYERVYPQQLAAIVEGNQKFKENKSIPTPAEQMDSYKNSLMNAIEEKLGEKEKPVREQTYELEEVTKTQKTPIDTMNKFQLSFSDISLRDKQEIQSPLSDKEQNSSEKSQELGITWAQEYKEQQEKEEREREEREPTPSKEEKKEKPYELKLSFCRLDEMDKSEHGIAPEAPEPEVK